MSVECRQREKKEREMIVAATRGSCRLVCLTGHFVFWPGLNKGWREGAMEREKHHEKKRTEQEGNQFVTQLQKLLENRKVFKILNTKV